MCRNKFFRRATLLLAVSAMLLHLSLGAGAAGTPQIRGEDCSAVQGAEIMYEVSVENNPGFAAALVYVLCDTEVFSVDIEAANQNNECCGELFGLNPIFSEYQTSKAKGWKASVFGASNAAADGVLFRIPIRISENAVIGEYPITISYRQVDTTDEYGNPVTFSAVNGKITVASNEPLIIADSKDAYTGTQIDYNISIKNNPGIAAFQFDVDCDATVFKLATNESGESAFQYGDLQNFLIRCAPNGNNGYKIVGLSNVNTSNDGVIVTLPFQIPENAPAGEQQIKINVNANGICDENQETLDIAVQDGTVNIIKRQLILSDEEINGNNISFQCKNADLHEKYCVIIAAYKNEQMTDIQMTSTALAEGKNVIPIKAFAGADELKMMIVEENTMIPCCAHVPFSLI